MRRFIVLLAVAALVALAGCGSRADTVSHNLSTSADNFQVARTITFYNGITGQSPLVIKGLCSIGDASGQTAPSSGGTLTVTCKVGPDKYIKDFLGLSDNITYFVSQNTGVSVSDTHYLIIFRPGTLIPGISIQ
jgi:ABC-type Fe3+-hydroxamate transport system substrate-binding protein